MDEHSPGTVTRMLKAITLDGEPQAERLFEIVYKELKRLARSNRHGEQDDGMLNTTALVHEAYLRLIGSESVSWKCRAHFFGAAAEAMRRILVDQARSRKQFKRGGAHYRIDIDPNQLKAEPSHSLDLIALNKALTQLEGQDTRMSQIVKLRFFARLSIEDTARALDLSTRTVNRDWLAARAWLHHELNGDDGVERTDARS